ncbi:cytochrome c biogenesis protein CcdA [Dongshaea marina]|uniref:cytochrome c biogenesis protein CcdA n=1 Tax=Dongshaea marina TaxID=2047966 RepID=UPI002D798689|nr:protein-disulfide reductase DsbD domain-containing protein [Dongshaea marina]
MLNRFKAAWLCLLLWIPGAWATDAAWLTSPQNTHAKVKFQAQTTQAGQTRMLVSVALKNGWKTYWRSPGEGGIAPSIRWQDPNIKTRWFWPTPQRFEVAGISTQGYQGDVSFPLKLDGVNSTKLKGTLTLPTCSNVCILTDYPIDIDLAGSPSSTTLDYNFTKAMAQRPLHSGVIEGISAGYRQGELQIVAKRKQGWRSPQLFIDSLAGTYFGEPKLKVRGDELVARVPVTDDFGDNTAQLHGRNISLVMVSDGISQESQVEVGASLFQEPATDMSLWHAILFALLGGFILNLMPCVLPVLGLKLGSVLQVTHRDRRQVQLQFLASSLGIISSFGILAGFMTLLRLTDQALGWGIQFQNPWFIGFMALVTALFSANLFELFTLRLPSRLSTRLATSGGQGLAGSFWQGSFATLLATPCSAPFLGVALAFALASPLPLLWGIFIALGFGMSLPWLLIATWPKIALALPRPGRWMGRLRIALGLMMLASSLWLISLLISHIGLPLTALIALFLIISLLLKIFMKHGPNTGIKVSVWATLALALSMTLPSLGARIWSNSGQDQIQWSPFQSKPSLRPCLKKNGYLWMLPPTGV